MKTLSVKSLFLILGWPLAGPQTIASTATDVEVTAAHYSKYIWRGQNLNDDPVFQTAASVSYGGLSAGIWGNMDLTNINGNTGDFSEIDYSLDYSAAMPGFEGIGYSLGAIYYDFPGTATPATAELYGALNFDLPLSPSVTLYHDVDEADGIYVSFAAGHTMEKIAALGSDIGVGMQIGASLGWGSASYNRYYWATPQSKLNDLVLSVSFPIQIAGWTSAPSVYYVTLVSDDIRDSDMYGTDSDFFLVGIGISRRF